MIKIALFNQKEGSGKTTSTINIAGYMAKNYNLNTLIIDITNQANITNILLTEDDFTSKKRLTLFDIFVNHADINNVIQPVLIKTKTDEDAKISGIDILPSKCSMSTIKIKSEYDIINLIKQIKKKYDVILFDCPSCISSISTSVLAATDLVLFSSTPDKDILNVYSKLISTINMLKLKGINENIKIAGIFLTAVSFIESLDKRIFTQYKENFGDLFITTYIRKGNIIKYVNRSGIPLCWLSPNCSVAKDYEKLTEIIIQKIKRYEIKSRIKNDIKRAAANV